MAEITIKFTGDDISIEVIRRALEESAKTTIIPESIWPGFMFSAEEVKA